MADRAVIYARVSTDEQAETGYSLGTQIDACRQYANNNDLLVVEEIADDYTGTKLDRPGLMQLFDLLEAGGANAVIVYSSDRWTRKNAHTYILRERLQKLSADLHYVSRGKSQDTPESRMVDGIEGVFNEYWRDKIIEGSTRGKRGKAQRGLFVAGRAPYGYRVDKTAPGGLEVIDDQAKTVRDIFDWYVLEGMSIRGIVDLLNSRQDKTPKISDTWGKSSISRILHNTAYIGYVYYNKYKRNDKILTARGVDEWIKIDVTPILDQGLFDLAQARLNHNRTMVRKQPTRTYLLSGMVICENCGKLYVAQTALAGRNRRANDAQSYRHRQKEGHCRNHTISARVIEPLIWEKITALLLEPETLREGYAAAMQKEREAQEKYTTLRDELYGLIGKLEQKSRNLLAAYTDPDIDLPKDEFKIMRGELDAQIKDAQAQIAELDKRLATIPSPQEYERLEQFMAEVRDRLTGAEWNPSQKNKRWLLEKLRVKVIVAGDGRCRITGWFGQNIGLSSSMLTRCAPRQQPLPGRA